MRYFCCALICWATLAAGCATSPPVAHDLPPVLTQEEVLRPYQRVAVLEVHRKRYGSSSMVTPEDYSWACDALRQEAARVGADAVIFPEVKVESNSDYLVPISETRGKGVAIRFQ